MPSFPLLSTNLPLTRSSRSRSLQGPPGKPGFPVRIIVFVCVIDDEWCTNLSNLLLFLLLPLCPILTCSLVFACSCLYYRPFPFPNRHKKGALGIEGAKGQSVGIPRIYEYERTQVQVLFQLNACLPILTCVLESILHSCKQC